MDSADASAPAVTALQIRIAHLEWVLLGLLGIILAVLLIGNVMAASSIAKHELIFYDMLGGKSLPRLTESVLRYGNTGAPIVVSIVAPLTAFIYLVATRQTRVAWYVTLAVIALMIFHWALIRLALVMPMQAIITLNQGQ